MVNSKDHRTVTNDMHINLLFVTGWLWPWAKGGPSVVLYNLVKNLAEKPAFSITVCGTVPFSQREKVYSYYPKNVKLIIAPTFWGADGLFDTISSQLLYDLKILAAKVDFDIVHFNILPGMRSATIPFIIKHFKNNSRAVFILNFHDVPLLEAYARSETRLKTIGTLVHWAMAKSLLNHFDIAVVNSQFMQFVAKNVTDTKNRIVVIPNGIGIELNKYVNKKPGRELKLLCIGGFFPKKGQDLLIKAFSRSKSLSFSHLYLVGKDTDFLESCKKLALNLGIVSKVTFLQPLPQNDLEDLIKSIDIYIQPSLWEGFGISILEAMAYGKPVIATKFGGPADFINNGENGLLVDPKDINALSGAIDALAFNHEQRQRIGKEGYLTATNFKWSRVVHNYVELYENAIKNLVL